jgi:alpha-L-rhamnosidase
MEVYMGLNNAKWIREKEENRLESPVFKKECKLKKNLKKATLFITALGVYEAKIDGERIGEFVMAPGWTSYKKRLQYQRYDITELLFEKDSVCLQVSLGNGWCVGRLVSETKRQIWSEHRALIASILLEYEDGTVEEIITDETWEYAYGPIRFSEIYDGETYDSRVVLKDFQTAICSEDNKGNLVRQDGEEIREMETLSPTALIHTPNGESIIDFGQNFTGYVRFHVEGKSGEEVELSHAEVLDKEGNFYDANMRTAKNKIRYICNGNGDTYSPHFTFQGFRYVRLDKWPGDIELGDFTGVVVYSNMKRRGYFSSSSTLLNRLYENVIWGQKGNFLDVPTDCPQRDERLGWTGDAQVFIKTAAYNYQVERFFGKWLKDLAVDQYKSGGVPSIIPDAFGEESFSAGWGDAAVICPWTIYQMYGNKSILEEQFQSMKAWVDCIRGQGSVETLWDTGEHFGDWLAIDAEPGEYVGRTDIYLIATAYYAYSTSILIKAGKVLEEDMSEYEKLYQGIRSAFQQKYQKDGKIVGDTQTADVIAIRFDLVDNPGEVAANLVSKLAANQGRLTTGFIGTPYLLSVLAEHGYGKEAYSLLLEEEYPSWLYSVKQGATTIWEHWDSLRPDGSMWSTKMNSFNHYAYGAVAEFLYERVAGINVLKQEPGFKTIVFAPIFDKRLEYAKASVVTKRGVIEAGWERTEEGIRYKVVIPEGANGIFRYEQKEKQLKSGVCILMIEEKSCEYKVKVEKFD